MEDYKKIETEHYDKSARQSLARKSSDILSVVGAETAQSYKYLCRILPQFVGGKKVLDYGCGYGMHAVEITRDGAQEVIGVDLSTESLKIARELIERERLGGKIKLLTMDCEALDIADNSFDIVFDGGTFSCLNPEKALEEMARVLKPGGFLIGIETLGHNPIANLNRRLNRKRGKRTEWTVSHVMKMKDIELAKRFFGIQKTMFFHLTSLVFYPFRNLPVGKQIHNALDALDNRFFLKIPFLKRFAFKIVFVFEKPTANS